MKFADYVPYNDLAHITDFEALSLHAVAGINGATGVMKNIAMDPSLTTAEGAALLAAAVEMLTIGVADITKRGLALNEANQPCDALKPVGI